MTTSILWAIVVLCVGLMLLFAELFIPSGGVLGVMSAVSLVASIVIAFNKSVNHGMLFLVVVLVAVPMAIGVGLTMWPQTPFGRRMMLTPKPQDVGPTSDADRELYTLIGQVGRTLTQLRPAGMTDFNGRRVDTLAESTIIDPDTLVRVVAVKGHRVVVRQLEPAESIDPNEPLEPHV